MTRSAARPFVKWAGGKTALLPEILRRLPAKINTYYEPFIGGGAVFFALAAEKRFERAVLNDRNAELMETYGVIRNEIDGLIRALSEHKYDEKRYYKVRALNPWALDEIDRGARLIYLNRTGFNGLYRVNKKGTFNVPFGRYTNPTICDEPNLRAVKKVLIRQTLMFVDFEQAVMTAKRGDTVYFDPPYVPVSKTANFTAYDTGGFGPNEHVRLRDVALKLVKRGVHVLLSNSDTSFVCELYQDFKIEKVHAPRRVNSKGDKRGDVAELLISKGKRS